MFDQFRDAPASDGNQSVERTCILKPGIMGAQQLRATLKKSGTALCNSPRLDAFVE